MIEVKNLRKSFGNLHVLKGIDLNIKKGEIAVIVGSSGSGKSTFLRCLTQLEEISSGKILVNGIDVSNNTRESRKVMLKIGMVFQQFNLFPHLTVLENVTLPLIKVQRMRRLTAVKKANKILRKLGLENKNKIYPNSLSGGQQQRVAIARELVRDPEILIFDEPTSALDPENVDEVTTIIKELARNGMTLIIVSHDIQFALDVADRVIFLENGQILADNSPQKIINSKDKRVKRFFDSALN